MTTRYNSQAERVQAAFITVHPEFDANTFKNDIAVITLVSPVKSTTIYATPAQHMPPVGTLMVVTGFGTIRAGGPLSETMQVHMPD